MLYARRLEVWGSLGFRAGDIGFRFTGLSDLTPGSSRIAPFHRTQYPSEELTRYPGQMSRKNNPAYRDYNSARTIALMWQ